MNTAKLNYQDFIRELREALYYLIPNNVKLDIFPVLKNNSLHLDGLVLHREDSKVSPNFYLQEYYDRYMEGSAISQLAEGIIEHWEEVEKNCPVEVLPMSFERCKSSIIYRLVNAKRNQELLEEIPHVPFQDLAIIFYYLVSQDQEGIGCIRISNDLMEQWEASTQTLMEWAGRNTPRLFPACCNPMSQILAQIIYHSSDEIKSVQGCPLDEPYVLTNRIGIHGATVWLYPQLLEKLASYFGKNVFILPSSIHELLILPDDGRFQQTDLIQMVAQVNEECVAPEEILSDSIYYYDRIKQVVCMSQNSD